MNQKFSSEFLRSLSLFDRALCEFLESHPEFLDEIKKGDEINER